MSAFRVVDLRDAVRLAPADLGRPPADAILAALEAAYVDRVVADVGLVVAVVALLGAEGGDVAPGDGAAHWRATFRVAAFRPAPGDVLVGTVASVDAEKGARVSLGFFDAVLVPVDGLPPPSTFDAGRGVWLHSPPDAAPADGESGGDPPLDIGPGAAVRCRVRETRFERTPPAGGGATTPHAPLVVTADFVGVGMGPVAWWAECEEEGGEGAAA